MIERLAGSWFVVLPDHEPAAGTAARIAPFAQHVVAHPSGRPWLIGHWESDEAVLLDEGPVRVAVLGHSDLTRSGLASRVRSLADLDAVADGLNGSAALVASTGGEVRVQGSAGGAQRIFHTEVAGVPVAADRALVLAWLTSAAVDERQLAARLAFGDVPYPLADGSMWTGVSGLSAGHALHLSATGDRRTWSVWRPPDPDVSLSEGAAALREALLAAVAVRVRPSQVIGADLSGGLDSTAICFAAAAAGARLVTATVGWADPANEDPHWAELAAADLPITERLVFGPGDLPEFFDDLIAIGQPADEPTTVMRNGMQKKTIAATMLAQGARQWLTGHGGDHLTQAPPHHVHGTVRRRPVLGLRQVNGFRARYRWPLARTAKALLDSGSYQRWLRTIADGLCATPTIFGAPWGWGDGLWLPPWSSDRATDALAGLLQDAAANAEPIVPDRTAHNRIHTAQTAGRMARQQTQASQFVGLPRVSPFCDDRVMAACLAVRPEETSTPHSYKPLLTAAMRGVVPDRSLTRTGKDRATVEWFRGLDANRTAVAALLDDSRLVHYGLVDPARFRTALLSPRMLSTPAPALEQTLAVEVWLRQVADLSDWPTEGADRARTAST
jgi:asparagine synthase (glutamine-hydrolysing)